MRIVAIPCSRSLPQRSLDTIGAAAAVVRERVGRIAAPAAIPLDHLPPWSWPVIAAAAGWPSLAWSLRRFDDGSDDPFGIVAWIALGLALLTARRRFDHRPRTRLLVAAAACASLVPLASLRFATPDLFRAFLATGATVLALAAIVDDDEPFLPYAGLAILALPLLSSLQFYAGYPLRVVTAEASRWLLVALGSSVARDGSALMVDGRLVLVDAPCSGIRMAWVGYFTACFAAWLFRTSNAALARRLPFVGIAILVGNIARNTVLVAIEAKGDPVAPSLHDDVGLATLAVVCIAIVAVFATCRDRVRVLQRVRVEARLEQRTGLGGRFFAPNVVRSARGAIVGVFVVAALLPLATRPARSSTADATVEWPTALDGEPLVPVALSAAERRFAGDFPGAIGRFTRGNGVVVLRDVVRPTPRLHPAVDCYRALGYTIAAEHLERRERDLSWRCFSARRGATGLRVCERIVDGDGQAFTDVSSWYWSAVLGRSRGPWRAATIAVPAAVTTGAAS